MTALKIYDHNINQYVVKIYYKFSPWRPLPYSFISACTTYVDDSTEKEVRKGSKFFFQTSRFLRLVISFGFSNIPVVFSFSFGCFSTKIIFKA